MPKKKRKRIEKPKKDLPPPAARIKENTSAAILGKRNFSLFLTLGVALLTPVFVFLYLAASTSDRISYEHKMTSWVKGKAFYNDTSKGVLFAVGKRPIDLFCSTPFPKKNYSLFSCELFIKRPIRGKTILFYGCRKRGGIKEKFRSVNLSSQVHRLGWNKIFISADHAIDLHKADDFVLRLASPKGKNIMGVRNARIQTFPFAKRCRQMLSELFKREPLKQSSINFILSQQITGYGFVFILWVSVPLACIIMFFRRFVLRESFNPFSHGVLTILIFFVMIDLHNSTDYFRNAQDAVMRRSSVQNIYDYFDELESSYPWFSKTLYYLKEGIPSGSRYYLSLEGPGYPGWVVDRLRYYARPLASTTVENADVAILGGDVAERFNRSGKWKIKTTLQGRVAVFERRK